MLSHESKWSSRLNSENHHFKQRKTKGGVFFFIPFFRLSYTHIYNTEQNNPPKKITFMGPDPLVLALERGFIPVLNWYLIFGYNNFLISFWDLSGVHSIYIFLGLVYTSVIDRTWNQNVHERHCHDYETLSSASESTPPERERELSFSSLPFLWNKKQSSIVHLV